MGYKGACRRSRTSRSRRMPGQMVALVGPSGAGKTTLTYLACRLYDPSSGRITFDGCDLRELALDDLAHAVAKVTQETTLFNATIEENLRYGRPEATRERDRARVPRRADSRRHRGAAARVRHRRRRTRLQAVGRRKAAASRSHASCCAIPRLLILDEATSSLDSRSEALIQRALEPLLAGRTSLVIAHRLSTILRADLILVLDQGRIVERGTHPELVVARGLYAKLYDEQFGPAKDSPSHAAQAPVQ